MRSLLVAVAVLLGTAAPVHAATSLSFTLNWDRSADESTEGDGTLLLDDGVARADGSTVFSITGISGEIRSIYLRETYGSWSIAGLSDARSNRLVRDAGGGFSLVSTAADQTAGLAFFLDGGPGLVAVTPMAGGTDLFFGEVGGFGRFTLAAAGAAVPEPASWAMMIAGFGLAGAAMRRRPRAGVPA